jgi:hypothetical protein
MFLPSTSQEMTVAAVISRAQRNLATGINANQGVKKSVVIMFYGVRTVNRHRWMGRESQGVRNNVR